MHRLIEDYEKALTEEFELRGPVDALKVDIKGFEAREMLRLIADDPKLPQWKTQVLCDYELYRSADYISLRAQLQEVESAYSKVKIRVIVAAERLKLTRARLYGGHHEVLDLQEMGAEPDPPLA